MLHISSLDIFTIIVVYYKEERDGLTVNPIQPIPLKIDRGVLNKITQDTPCIVPCSDYIVNMLMTLILWDPYN